MSTPKLDHDIGAGAEREPAGAAIAVVGSPDLAAARRRRRFRFGSVERLLARPLVEADSDREIRFREAVLRRFLAAADLGAVGFALLLCISGLGDDSLRWTTFLALPLVVVVSKLKGLYDRDELLVNKTTLDESPKLFQLATLYALVFTVLEASLINGQLGSVQILTLWAALFASSFTGRFVARRLAFRVLGEDRCLFVGTEASFVRLRDKLTRRSMPVALVNRMALTADGADPGADIATGLAALQRLATDHRVHRVIIEPSDASPQLTLDFVREAKAMGIRVSVLPRILEVLGTSIEVDDVQGMTLLGVRRFGLSRSSRAVKRAFDAVGAAALLVALGPVLAIIALLIKRDSRGPLFYRAPRVGRDGRSFDMWKFRSMCPGADELRAGLGARNEAGSGLFKMADDPRMTRFGAKLRRLSLDELPQLFNVLRGEMSLVGPRPLLADEDAQILGLDRRRLHLTPGMTGHWQILGSSRLPISEMVKLDYLYVAGWSLWNDVKILLRTVPYVLGRRGM